MADRPLTHGKEEPCTEWFAPFGWLDSLCASSQDLSDSSASEQLRQARAAFRSLVDNLPLNLLIKDTAGRRVFANRHYLAYRQASLKEVLGKTDFELFPTKLAQKFSDDDQKVARTGEVLHDLEEHQAPDGTVRWIERIKGPLRNAEGAIVGIQVIFWDVTQRKEVEQELDRERYLLHSLMDSIPDAIYFKDRNSRFLRISRALAEKFRLGDATEAICKTDADIFTAEHAEAALADEQEIMRTGRPMVARIERETWPDRDDTWVSSTKAPLLDNEGRIVGTFGISRDITELKRTQDELRQARDAADAASRAKSDFLANMSHEIRTPLNAVIGITELLLDTGLTQSQREYLRMVQESGESLLELLNDVLDFSKIEAGKIELTSAPFDLRERVGDMMKSLAVRAHGKGLELACAIDANVPHGLVGDVGRLRQVIMNLVGNAIKFTDKGEVLLDVRCQSIQGDRVTIRVAVEDTGIGVPKNKQERIFEVFQQADASTTRSYGGTGLGLAIASRLVELMGGRLDVQSEPGRGSTFFFTANFEVEPGFGRDVPDRPVVLVDTPLLIVDDNATNRRILMDMMSNWGLRPTAAASAREGFDRMIAADHAGDPFQLVLLDVNMPEVDGFELAAWIRKNRALADTPLIMLTSAGRPGDLDRRSLLGVAGSLLKPVKQSELFDLVVEVLGVTTAERREESEAASSVIPSLGTLDVLLAEDNAVNQKLSIAVLDKLGCSVTLAADGRKAVAAYQAHQFDVILMDVQMPLMDGFEATREIRTIEQQMKRHTPIIAMTAHAMTGDREACLKAGMDDYLPKPVRIHELAKKLATVLHKEHVNHGPDVPGALAGGLIDWPDALQALGGDMSLLKIVIDTFMDEAESLLQRVRGSIQRRDAEALKASAHLIKGALVSIGAHQASKLATELECMGQSANLRECEKLFAQMQHQIETLAPVLQRGPPWPGQGHSYE